jgi:TPR repeat protein
MAVLQNLIQDTPASGKNRMHPPFDDDPNTPDYWQPLRREDYDQAISLLLIAADKGDETAMALMGALCALGNGIERDPEMAAMWFHEAATCGNLLGQTAFGLCLACGFGVRLDLAHAATWLYQAARLGSHPAREALEDLVLISPWLLDKILSPQNLQALYADGVTRCAPMN